MSTQETTTEKKKTSFSEKLKGAGHVIHGIGENIRGSVMGAVESVSGSEEGKAKDSDIVAKGKMEIEQGVAQMKGVEPPSTTDKAPEGEAKTGEEPQQPAKQETAAATAPAPATPSQTPVRKEESQAAAPAAPPSQPAAPSQTPIRTEDVPSQQAQTVPQTAAQEPTVQTGTKQSTQESQAATSTAPVEAGTDVPRTQGTGSSA